MTALDEIHSQVITCDSSNINSNSNSNSNASNTNSQSHAQSDATTTLLINNSSSSSPSTTTTTQTSTTTTTTMTTNAMSNDLINSDTSIVFPTGSFVECHTALSTHICGQVLSYDHPTRLLLIKDTSSGPKPLLRLLNLALVEKVTCVGDRNADYVPYTSAPSTQQQIHERIRKAEARKLASLLQTDVTLEGQRIFLYLRKTLDEVRWQDANIVVLNRVLVHPPYTPDSVQMLHDTVNSAHQHAKDHVCKILSKYHSMRQPPLHPPPHTASHPSTGHQHTSPSAAAAATDDAPADPTPSQ